MTDQRSAYQAYLSYSHADRIWAERLQRRIENFRLDSSLTNNSTQGRKARNSRLRVFRESHDLASGANFSTQIIQLLNQSEALIVICSPASASSRFINEEIHHFRSEHPDRIIIPVIVEGEYPNNMPLALRDLLAVDLRESGDGLDRGSQKVIAGLLRLPPDEIFRREMRRLKSKSGRPSTIDASAFCPTSLRAGESEIIQVVVHSSGQRRAALKVARQADERSFFAGPSKQLGELKSGDVVAVALQVDGARVVDPPEDQKWTGGMLIFAFRVLSDGQAKSVGVNATISINGAYVGRITFKRRVAIQRSWIDYLTTIFPPRLSKFKRVFFSYARTDREHVKVSAAEYERFGIEFFQDILSLDPGERWRKRLWKEIDRCDVFVLFWSKAAQDSEWVIKEADRAWRRQASNGGLRPTLRPEVLEYPAPVPSQDWLKDFHFDDPKYYKK